MLEDFDSLFHSLFDIEDNFLGGHDIPRFWIDA
jgi:hypothetical protein